MSLSFFTFQLDFELGAGESGDLADAIPVVDQCLEESEALDIVRGEASCAAVAAGGVNRSVSSFP